MSLSEIAQQFDQKADSYSHYYYKSNSTNFRSVEKKERARITGNWLKYCLRQNHVKILDVGCGAGTVLSQIIRSNNSWRGFGIDISPRMIHNAKQLCDELDLNEWLEFQVKNIEGVNESFDAVVSLGVIGYQEEQIQFLENLAKTVSPAGFLIFTYGNRDSIVRRFRNVLLMFKKMVSTKRTGIPFEDIYLKTIDQCLSQHGMERIEIKFLTFGLGKREFFKAIAKYLDKMFGKKVGSKYFSLTGIVLYRKIVNDLLSL